jgi:hypothetical protein
MLTTTRLTASTIALLAGISLAQAQTANPAAPMPSPAGPGMGPMMGGDMGQMMRMMSGMMPREGGGMDMMPGQHVEGRVAYLKAELGITDAQLPQWNAFADAMRNGAKTMQSTMAANMGQGMPATAPARSDVMIAMMTARLEAMKSSAAASKALYAVLTDAQKKIADDLLMSRMGGM